MAQKVALFLDIDHTSYEEGDNSFLDYIKAHRDKFIITYVSGRSALDRGGKTLSVMNMAEQGVIPQPDYVIGDVGAEIYDVAADKYVEGWPNTFSRWSREEIEVVVEGITDKDGYVDQTRTKVERQPQECQGSHKISYYLRGDSDNIQAKQRIEDLLSKFFDCNLIFSSNRDLDVMPAGVHKGAAVAFLAKKLGISPQQCLVAGDSGNDIGLITQSGASMAVLPGNASKDLKDSVAPETLLEANGGEICHHKNQFIYYNPALKGPTGLVAGIKKLTAFE